MATEEIAVFVTVTVVPEKLAEFLEVMKTDTLESRKEEGCLRFDVLKNDEVENVYHFYEVYKDKAAHEKHRTLPHYLAWGEFKKEGAREECMRLKMLSLFMNLSYLYACDRSNDTSLAGIVKDSQTVVKGHGLFVEKC